MQLLRRKLGPQIGAYTQTAWAKALGIGVKRWNNFERGAPLSADVARLIRKRFPAIEWNWLMEGDAHYLPPAISDLLRDAPLGPGKSKRRA